MSSANALPLNLNSGTLVGEIWRQRGRFLVWFFTFLSVAVAALLFLPPSYYATGSVLVAGPEPLPGAVSSAATATWEGRIGDPADLDSNILEIMSPRLLRVVLTNPAALNVVKAECEIRRQSLLHQAMETLERRFPSVSPKTITCDKMLLDVSRQLQWVKDRYSATVAGRSRVLQVGYNSPLPLAAQTMTNLLINAYLDDEKSKRRSSRDAGVLWLRQEISRLNGLLELDDRRIQEFRINHGLLQGQSSNITSEQLTETTKLLADAQANQARTTADLHQLDSGNDAAVPAVMESRVIEDLKHQMSTITANLAGLSQKTRSDSTLLLPIRKQREDVQQSLDQETRRIRESIHRRAEIASMLSIILTKQVANLKVEAGQASNYEMQIAGIIRDAQVKRELYIELSKRANELETEREVLDASSALVSLAELPISPSFPQPFPFLVGGGTVAGILATMLLLSKKDTRFEARLPEMLEAATKSPVLASVPFVSRAPRLGLRRRPLSLTQLMQQMHVPSMFQESMRRLNAQINLLSRAKMDGGYTVLVTSFKPQDGKSLVSSGIARFAAAGGKRVLLIECDLRKPSLQSAFGSCERTLGLADYLMKRTDDLPIVKLPDQYGFDVVFAGEANFSSTELLSASRFSNLLKAVRHYDLVVLDTPPGELTMDAGLIASNADGIVYCARWKKADPDRIASNLKQLEAVGGNIIGLVVTFAPDQHDSPYGANFIQQQRLSGNVA